jgi:outer membrane immunogenic protein
MWCRVPVLASTCVLVALRAASGADLPVPQATVVAPVIGVPVPLAPWTGFYIGGNIGYGWANTNSSISLLGNAAAAGPFSSSEPTLQGLNGGIQGGYNWQVGYLLVGAEGDVQIANQTQNSTYICGGACSITEAAEIESFATMRARVGLAYRDVLVYGTGGFSWTDSKRDFGGTFGAASASLASFSQVAWGWAAGAGIEWMFYNSLSAKLEFLHLQNSSINSTIVIPAGLGGGVLSDNVKSANNIVRVGLNYHFFESGWPNR